MTEFSFLGEVLL